MRHSGPKAISLLLTLGSIALATCSSDAGDGEAETSDLPMCSHRWDDCTQCTCEITTPYVGRIDAVTCSNFAYQSEEPEVCAPYCASDGDCQDGYICQRQAWGADEDPAPGACTRTGPDDWVCGVCVEACSNDDDCPTGYVCDSRSAYPDTEQSVMTCRGFVPASNTSDEPNNDSANDNPCGNCGTFGSFGSCCGGAYCAGECIGSPCC